MNGDAWPRCRACAASSTAASSPGCGATRPGRAASATSSPGSCAPACRPATPRGAAHGSPCTSTCTALAARAAGRRSTAWSRWTGSAATGRCWSTTSCPGVIVGLTLATRPEDIYRALLEATAFGTRMIIEAFEAAGVPVAELIVAGGLAKNALLMQIYADVTAPAAVDLATRRRARRSARPSTPPSPPAATPTWPPRPRRWAGRNRRVHARPANARRLRRALRRVPRRCTTTSAAAATTSCTGCGGSATRR